MKYYCNDCSNHHNLINVQTVSLLANAYQEDRFGKHLSPGTRYPVNSVFNSSSTAAYEEYIKSASSLGFIEIDSLNRKNVIYPIGKIIGTRYKYGTSDILLDSIKVALPEEPNIHGFAVSSTDYSDKGCSFCSAKIMSE